MILSGRNFQSWEDFNLEIQGLTVLVGPSNKGKSAIFRALKALCRNQIAEAFIRNKQNSPLEISLDIGGHKFVAKRSRKGSTEYIIDGNRLSKLAGVIPEDVLKLGFNEIRVGEFVVDPIFAEQNEPQFLLDRKAYGPTLINAILGAFASTDKLEIGKKEANLRITQKNSEARTLATEIREHEELKLYLDKLVTKSEVVGSNLHSLEAEIRKEEALLVWANQTTNRLAILVPLRTILNELVLPELKPALGEQACVTFLQQAGTTSQNLKNHKTLAERLERLVTSWSDLIQSWKAIKNLEEIKLVLEQPAFVICTEVANGLNSIISLLEDSFKEAVQIQSSIKYIGQVGALRERISAKQSELVKLEQDLASAKQQVGLCPECGEPLEHRCQKRNQ